MRSLIITFIFFFCVGTYSQTLSADEKQNSAKDPKKNLFTEFEDYLRSKGDMDPTFVEKMDAIEKELRVSLLSAEYEYDISVYRHRREVFDWQQTSSKIIFWVVIIIVFVGLLFSGVQFYISIKQEKRNLKEDEKENIKEGKEKKDLSKTEIEASLKGIKVSSSVLGIIILIISLLFFYLYLVHVYPIKEIGIEPKIEAVETR